MSMAPNNEPGAAPAEDHDDPADAPEADPPPAETPAPAPAAPDEPPATPGTDAAYKSAAHQNGPV